MAAGSRRSRPTAAKPWRIAAAGQDQGLEPQSEITAEPSFLYSNRSAWYPQATTTDYATATLKISVPTTYDCVASGVLQPGWPQVAGTKEDQSERKVVLVLGRAAAPVSVLHRQQVRPGRYADGDVSAVRAVRNRRAESRARAQQPDHVGRSQPAAGEARSESWRNAPPTSSSSTPRSRPMCPTRRSRSRSSKAICPAVTAPPTSPSSSSLCR